MVVENHHIGTALGCGQRRMGGNAAIDADDQPRPGIAKRGNGGGIGAIALAQPVGHVMAHLPAAQIAQALDHQRAGTGAIHIIIGKDRHRLIAAHRLGDARGGLIHIAQDGGVGQQGAQLGGEEIARRIGANATRGEQAADQFWDIKALGEHQPGALLGGAPGPGAPRGALRHTQCRFRQ